MVRLMIDLQSVIFGKVVIIYTPVCMLIMELQIEFWNILYGI